MEWNLESKTSTKLEVTKWNLVVAIVLVLSASVDFYKNNLFVFPISAIFSFLVLRHLYRLELKTLQPLGGYANWVTFFRLSNVIIFSFSYHSLSEWWILGLWALVVVSLDGLDGYLARRLNQQSDFGGKFDMETDAFYVATMSLLLVTEGLFDWWILIPGFLKYIYEIVRHMIGNQHQTEDLHKWSKWFAVAFFLSLLSPLFFSDFIATVLLILASLAILFSFGYAFINLLKNESKGVLPDD